MTILTLSLLLAAPALAPAAPPATPSRPVVNEYHGEKVTDPYQWLEKGEDPEVQVWSKAQDASGSTDSGYSLYVDLVYADGTPLWGQTANFPTGTHNWVRREALIIPQKPVKALTLNCILRGHSGLALFDDVTVEELKPQGGTVLFQGVPVTPAGPAPRRR